MKLVPTAEAAEPLPYDPEGLRAARDVADPTQGGLRRRPGKDADKEDQDPVDDWDGA